tara:strand:- start:12351 stop:12683 length:333 start_codon:yes stop_codon:yes gene_type:complete
MNTTVLVDRTGYKRELEEIRWNWAKDLLIYIGIDEDFLNESDMPTIVDFLINNNIEILDYPSIGAMSISYDGDIVGEWAGPEMELCGDENGFYFKVDVESWSILEEEISE